MTGSAPENPEPGQLKHTPGPFPPRPPGASPAATVAALDRALVARGIADVYTATSARFGLVSVAAAVPPGLTAIRFGATVPVAITYGSLPTSMLRRLLWLLLPVLAPAPKTATRARWRPGLARK
jgi:hypothetical protein